MRCAAAFHGRLRLERKLGCEVRYAITLRGQWGWPRKVILARWRENEGCRVLGVGSLATDQLSHERSPKEHSLPRHPTGLERWSANFVAAVQEVALADGAKQLNELLGRGCATRRKQRGAVSELPNLGALQVKRALLIILSIAFPLACAFAGMVLILLSNPEVNIDEGWRLGWLGLPMTVAPADGLRLRPSLYPRSLCSRVH